MKIIKCTIHVEIDEDKLKRLGYDRIEDYLNECRFCVYDDEHDDICESVDEYDVTDKNEIN